MNSSKETNYMKNFLPYALAAFLIGIVGGLSTVLGPAFMLDMNLPYNNTTWTALSQAISTAACAPILGKLGDIFGRRKTLLLGILVFTLGSILSALSTSLIFMIIARFVVGIGSAAITPTVMSYIITEFPPKQIAKGFSIYMLISSAAVIFGPTLGGIILELSDWRALMWFSSIVCVIFLLLCFFTLPKQTFIRKPLKNFDFSGAFFVIAFFSFLLCVPSFGQNFGWTSTPFLVVLTLSLITLVLLVIAEKKAKNPILIGSFLARKAFIMPVIILFLTQGLMQTNMTNTIVFVNYTQPTNTAISGYAISIMYVGMSLGAIILGPLADRFEPKRILSGSLLLTGIGCGTMLLFSKTTSLFLLATSLGILGFGLGANATIFMKIVLSNLPAGTAGSGTGIYGLFRDLAAPFGVAIFVPMFTNEIVRLSANSNENLSVADIAVNSIHKLAIIEIVCVAIAVVIVQLLPKIYQDKNYKEIEKQQKN
ncbi:MAG: MFS transporter [Lachnospiraceae bacterium]|nr:MFS transporter [Lachnospiraceae bacterium]